MSIPKTLMQPLLVLEKFSSKEYDEARQKVAYMKATSLFKSGQFAEADQLLHPSH